jgi:hypothetical protein
MAAEAGSTAKAGLTAAVSIRRHSRNCDSRQCATTDLALKKTTSNNQEPCRACTQHFEPNLGPCGDTLPGEMTQEKTMVPAAVRPNQAQCLPAFT